MENKKLFAITVILFAINLRAPFLAVTPILDIIGNDLQLDKGMLGWLTTIPLIVFSILSSFFALWGNKYGIGRVIFLAMMMLGLGSLWRYAGTTSALYGGTILLSVGIAGGNVLIPSMIKAVFPNKIGLMTALYSSLMGLATAIIIAMAVPATHWVGWRDFLALLLIPLVVALLMWWPYRSLQFLPTAAMERESYSVRSIFKQPLAWYIALYMGVQSFMFFCFTTWLPAMLIDKGLTAEEAGYLASLFQTMSLLCSFFVPLWIAAYRDQRYHATGCVALYTLGTIGILLNADMTSLIISVIFLGLGAGSTFAIALVYFGVRVKTPQAAAILSGVGQSVGYILAAVGPVLLGYLYDYTEQWYLGLLILLVTSLVFMWLGYEAGKDRLVQ